jgi:hypothetical protein
MTHMLLYYSLWFLQLTLQLQNNFSVDPMTVKVQLCQCLQNCPPGSPPFQTLFNSFWLKKSNQDIYYKNIHKVAWLQLFFILMSTFFRKMRYFTLKWSTKFFEIFFEVYKKYILWILLFYYLHLVIPNPLILISS